MAHLIKKWAVIALLTLATESHGGQRISLDGEWQIAQGGMEKPPSEFPSEVVVPGIARCAKYGHPGFV